MSTIGIIGSGNIGSAVARLATQAEFTTIIANSRGPASLTDLVADLGPRASAGTVEQAASADIVVVAVPLTVTLALPPELLAGTTVLDSSNYYPSRDGRIGELDDNSTTTSELVQAHLAKSRLVKAFNNILAHHITELARPAGADDRSALPLAGDHPDAVAAAAGFIDALGFDTVDTGPLSDSWRLEPETGGYTQLYLVDPSVAYEQIMTTASAPLPADRLRRALAGVPRIDVGSRTA
ncbi:NAD(P)-binding domain-containing protein [Cellulomonas sp. ACRRI]|uniref:NADPH-dependent F420 reductase n=1 Tax=Cellulomonas sp. ACRRI TaxID=2918188 RepID=UPI001EF330AD|nr:NAD(P)-binding domain-containing protein [Cellulomonas sp. ACRRI]MCG7284452.1 NAD(P)-binding domain-containing protein [Cellulomonas sp. ACRRI]